MIILGGVLFGIIAFILINTGFFHKEIKLARMIAIAEYFIDIGIITIRLTYNLEFSICFADTGNDFNISMFFPSNDTLEEVVFVIDTIKVSKYSIAIINILSSF